MIYAPVLITTVNRYQHFKECIESLSKCTWADKTDVFVAVDYPPSEKYWEGYNQIKDYLDNCDGLGFKSLNVTYRETNFFYKEGGNLGPLIEKVGNSYDRYIITEDDNVFSPNFLMYIDKGLEKYEKDQSVMAIVGYKHFLPLKYEQNSYFRQNVDFSAWGFGIWKNRMDDINNFAANDGFYRTFSLKNAIKLYKNGRYRFIMYLGLSRQKKKVVMSDNPLSVYMALNNMDIVMPSMSLVRNQGWDGTGIHCPTNDNVLANKHMKQEISVNTTFDYIGSGFEHYKENHRIFAKNNAFVPTSYVRVLRATISFVLKRLLSITKL